jgi:hypothetical protein
MVINRNAVRGIVLTPELEVLLLRIRRPERGDGFWITPGGGLESGETEESGLRRWWHADELTESREALTPRSLADIVARYLAHGAAADVTQVEVLVD